MALKGNKYIIQQTTWSRFTLKKYYWNDRLYTRLFQSSEIKLNP